MPEPKAFFFPLKDGQKIFVEESGNPLGKPVIVIHGGPFKCRPSNHRHLFDPNKYRIIYFDQRGANKSRDSQFLNSGNYMKLIVSDMEELRTYYKIDRWMVFGSSWGGAVAMVYTQTHPEKVSEVLLRFPSILRTDRIQAMKNNFPNLNRIVNYDNYRYAYLAQRNFFLRPDQILKDMRIVSEIPATIVHGDRDANVPIAESIELHSQWPRSKLIKVSGADHNVYDERISAALIEASNAFAAVP